MRNLDRKVVVVTGGGSGIGREACLQLAAKGAVVAVCDLRADGAKETADAVTRAGGHASAHTVDVSSEGQVADLLPEVLEQHGAVDVLVNNAGIGLEAQPTVDTDITTFQKLLDVNLWGVIYGVKTFLPHLLTRPEANIVNTCSFGGMMGMTQLSPYTISKFGVRGFTEALQMEFHGSPLTVSVVYPGATRTALMRHSPFVEPSRGEALAEGQLKSRTAAPADRVGRAILRCVLKNKNRALVGPDTQVMDKITRVLPGAYPALLGPVFRRILDNAWDG